MIECILVLFALIACAFMIYPLAKMRVFNLAYFPVLLFVAFVSYQLWGSYEMLHAQQLLKSVHGPQELIKKLRAKLDDTPASAKGWYLLGRLYSAQNQTHAAQEAFAKAYQFNPKEDQYAVNYALMLWLNNGRVFDANIRGILNAVLERNPEHSDALRLMSLDNSG